MAKRPPKYEEYPLGLQPPPDSAAQNFGTISYYQLKQRPFSKIKHSNNRNRSSNLFPLQKKTLRECKTAMISQFPFGPDSDVGPGLHQRANHLVSHDLGLGVCDVVGHEVDQGLKF